MTGSRRGYTLMLSSSACFSVMGLLVGLCHDLQPNLSTGMASLIRAIVNLVMLVIVCRRDLRALVGDGRPALWVRGLFGGLALITYFAAVAQVGLGEAAFLNQTSAVWVAVLAPRLLGERTGPWIWAAIAGSMIGMFLLAVPRAAADYDSFGRVLGAVSGLMAGLAYVAVRRAGATNAPTVIVFYFTLVATAISMIQVGIEGVAFPASPLVWVLLVGVGVAATAGQLLMTRAYAIGPATAVAVVAYAGPLFASLLGWGLLGEVPDRAGMAGMSLILACGIALPFLAWTRAVRVASRA